MQKAFEDQVEKDLREYIVNLGGMWSHINSETGVLSGMTDEESARRYFGAKVLKASDKNSKIIDWYDDVENFILNKFFDLPYAEQVAILKTSKFEKFWDDMMLEYPTYRDAHDSYLVIYKNGITVRKLIPDAKDLK